MANRRNNPSISSHPGLLVLLLFGYAVLTEGLRTISVPKLKGIEPQVIEIPPGGLPLSLFRNKRQTFSNASHIGVTAKLIGDNHNVAVVHWSGYPSENIFILTKRTVGGLYGRTTESFLWRSKDYGVTFQNETDKFPSDAVAHWYYVSKDNVKIIFKDLVRDRFYVTTDEGDSYTTYNLGFDPSIVSLSYSAASSPNYVFCRDTTSTGGNKLYVSNNLGASWFHIGSNVSTASWTYLKEGQTFDDPTTIFFTVRSTTAGTYRVMKASYPYQNKTDDIGEVDPHLGDVVHFEASYEYLFAIKNITHGSPLFISYLRRPFVQAQFPSSLEQKQYSVVDASEGQVFIAVYHNENHTNLYLSDEEGVYYSLTLEDVITNEEDDWINGNAVIDVHVVEGIKGTYIANIDVERYSYGATVISFDKGGEWVPLTAPTLDLNGVPLNCFAPSCSLHLHMESTLVYGYTGILSRDSAVGLIMAQGNIGTHLDISTSRTRVYFSHDGGFSWQELFRYSYVFQFLDSGSIVAAVRKYAYTRVVEFSCDEGVTWNTYNIFHNNSDRMYVVGLFTEIGERAVHVTAFGLESFPFEQWLIVDLDFSVLGIPQCVRTNDNTTDYMEWVPTDERIGQRCLLGERVVYEKRISGHCCINGAEYERPINTTTCECSIEDFECDFGFERIDIDSPCTPVRGYNPNAIPSNCSEGHTYTVSSGYRRIAGDKCTISKDEHFYFLPTTLACPVGAPGELYLIEDTKHFGAGETVSFELVQLAGGKLYTVYRWYWGDGTANNTRAGYDNGRNLSHTYASAGTYTLIVTVTNKAGSARVEKDITVLDPLYSVTINGPKHFAAYTTVTYSCVVQSLNGTEYYTPVTYQWSFSDGYVASGTSVSRHYTQAASLIITCTATNPISVKSNSTQVLVVETIENVILNADPATATVNQDIDFSVTMKESDFYGLVIYAYSFGDGTTSGGRSTISTATHSYTSPGRYTVQMSVENIAGSVSVTRDIYIQDKIVGVNISTLSIPLSVIVDREVVFTADVETDSNSNYYTPVIYQWDFGDGINMETTVPTVTHTYSTPGSWNVSVSASNNVSSPGPFIGIVNVAKGVSHVRIYGPSIAAIDDNITYIVHILNDDEILPYDTIYTWTITHHSTGNTVVNVTGRNLEQYSTTLLSTPGSYEVVVLGQYAGGSFTASITTIIRSGISDIGVEYPAVVEAGREATLAIHLYNTDSNLYTGSVNLTITSNGESNMMYFDSAPQKISTHLLYDIVDQYPVRIVADNKVSKATQDIIITVVITNISVIITFDTNPLTSAGVNYENTLWKQQFAYIVYNQITQNLNLSEWRLNVMLMNVRDSSDYITVQVDVVPESMEDEKLSEIKDVSDDVINLVTKEGYTFSSPGNIPLAVYTAELQQAAITTITNTSYIHDNKKSTKLAVELGVGIGLALLVAIILCVLGIVYYRRKYHKLEVQYSRLRQSDTVQFNVSDQDDNSCGEPTSPNEMTPVEDNNSTDEL